MKMWPFRPVRRTVVTRRGYATRGLVHRAEWFDAPFGYYITVCGLSGHWTEATGASKCKRCWR